MQLQALLGPETTAPPGCGGVEIAGITADSRQVQAGWLFAAIAGSKADGARFVPEAVAKGAAAILVKDGTRVDIPQSVAVLTAAEPRRALALMAARFYPAQPSTIVAVTGTSGKTSVADFARQIFAASRPQGGLHRHHRPGQARRQRLRRPHHARPRHPAPDIGRAGGRGRHASGLRGLLARPRSAPARRRPAEGRGLHQPRPRSSRLSPEHGGLSRGQAAPLHRAAAARRHCRRQRRCRARSAGDRRRAKRRPRDPDRRHGGRGVAAGVPRPRRLRPAPACAPCGPQPRHPPAPAGRLPGRQRAARRGPCHCHRRAGRPGPAGAGAPREA